MARRSLLKKLGFKKMKRIMIRLSLLSIVVALGIYAIAEAQREQNPESTGDSSATETDAGSEASATLQPIAMSESTNEFRTSPAHRLTESQSEASAPSSLFANNRLGETSQPSESSAYAVRPAASEESVPLPSIVAPAPLQAPATDNLESGKPVPQPTAGTSAPPLTHESPTPAPPFVSAPENSDPATTPFPITTPAAPPESPPFDPGTSLPPSQPAVPLMPSDPPRDTFSRGSESGYESEPIERSPVARRSQEGTGLPGRADLEGPQQAQLELQKTAPEEIQVGQPSTFEIRIRNVGQTVADKVLLRDEVPRDTRLIDTVPASIQGADGSILWELGSIGPGEETVVTMQVVPQSEGEIGSVATVSYQTSATARSIVTRPLLVIEHTAPERVLIGEEVLLRITLTNQGSGDARRIILEEDVPQGLTHQGGHELEYEIGTLKPGESRQLELALTADEAGILQNTIRARGEANLLAEHSVQINIVAPELMLNIAGPTRRYLEREAMFEIVIANPGTATAHEINLSAHLPRGLQFVNTNNAGEYDPQQHAVFWSLEELPAGQRGSVEITTLPIETGQHRIQIDGSGDMGLTATQEHALEVEGLAELVFEVADIADPVEAGSEATYEIRVVNQGSKVATNIRLAIVVPPEMRPLSGDGPTREGVEGQQITFEPLARLAPKADTLFHIRVQCLHPGDHRIRVLVASDDMDTVIKEEATRVYTDQ